MIMSKHILLSLTVAMVLLGGCTQTKQVYVTQRDVPAEPSFTVMPANFSGYQVTWANDIESVLINLGVRVLDRPGTVEVRTEEQLQAGETTSDQRQAIAESTEKSRILAYSARDFSSTYLVQSFAGTGQVRIVNIATDEVQASFTVGQMEIERSSRAEEPSDIEVLRDNPRAALRNMGIDVRQLSEE